MLLVASVAAQAQLINGNFETGDFTGWTVFTDTNGDTGNPAVVQFDTAGTGTASYSAQFEVGIASFPVDSNLGSGGGISQNVTLNAGELHICANLAAYCPGSITNHDAGNFELMLDGNVVATNFLGLIASGQTIRSNLNYSGTIAAGTHEIAIDIRRPYLNSAGLTPYEYLDNITATVVVPPNPIPLNIQRHGSTVILTWTNSAFGLQSAPTPVSVFTNIPGASSPYTNTISGAAQYFRLMAN